MFSQTSDYALRATLFLARHRNGPLVRAHEVAAATGVPRSYLSKMLHALARAGIVSSTRGPTGGFTLIADPATLTVADIVDCFDTGRATGPCLLGARACDPVRPCVAHSRWNALHAARRAPLLQTTVADLIAGAKALPSARPSSVAHASTRQS